MAKLQRWVDLLAALLRRHSVASLEELRPDVPAYLNSPSLAALRRTFERDKDELRTFGVPIQTITDSAGEVMGYQLKRENFYLPYLSLIQDRRRTSPARVDRYGYRSLPELAFEADELEAVSEGARRVEQLGDPMMTELARSAIRKLAFDLPVDAASRSPIVALALAESRPVVDVLQGLDMALRNRKYASIEYHTFGSDETRVRRVSPFGLFFLGSHWYLAAQEDSAGPVKNFRVSRISDVEVNDVKPGTPDFDIPSTFDLRAHATSRQAWELGDATGVDVVVEFRGVTGPTVAAQRLGEAIAGSPSQRRFRVRRLDPFCRWLLSFAGEAVPLSPPEVVEAFEKLASQALAAAEA